MSLRWRLQKGNPRRAFERARQGLRSLYALGLPVPPIVHEGPDYFVTPDMGISLAELYFQEVSLETRNAAIIAAARVLHQVHAAGVAHGRPKLKDMLWDGEDVTLINLERFGKTRNIHWAQVFDFIIFALSCFAVANRSLPEIDQALYLYQTLDVRGVFESAYRSLKWIRWLDPLAKRLQAIRSSRDMAAILQFFRWMRRQF
jgi:hypothetical protein